MKSRNCPSCGILIEYHVYCSFYSARKYNKSCKSCATSGVNNPFYGKRHNSAQKEKWSHAREGNKNVMYGKGGMLNKNHSSDTIARQRLARKKYWEKLGANPTEFERYRAEVDRLTRKQPLHDLENFEKRGRAGIEGVYHLDHIVSVWTGFQNKYPPNQIADITNLRMIPWLDNQKKWLR
jgi:hypothetical protein